MYHSTFRAAILTIAAASCSALALDGYVLLLQEQFTAGRLEILNVATGRRTTPDDGTCFGPCFSPDGSRVAYNRNNRIYIRNSDGSVTPTVVDVYCDSNGEAAMNWVTLGSADYIYWSETSRKIYRVKLGTTNKETVHTSSANLYSVSVSCDGSKAACSKRAWSCWAIDVGGAERNLGSGCQGSVSPNGVFVTHNLEGHTKASIHGPRHRAGLSVTHDSAFVPPSFAGHSSPWCSCRPTHLVYCLCSATRPDRPPLFSSGPVWEGVAWAPARRESNRDSWARRVVVCWDCGPIVFRFANSSSTCWVTGRGTREGAPRHAFQV